jgi:hypothetical protein
VVKNGSKMWGSMSAGMPGPLSPISTTTQSGDHSGSPNMRRCCAFWGGGHPITGSPDCWRYVTACRQVTDYSIWQRRWRRCCLLPMTCLAFQSQITNHQSQISFCRDGGLVVSYSSSN